MRRVSISLRKSVVVAGGILAGALILPVTANAGPVTINAGLWGPTDTSFSADSGDPCPHGTITGTVAWTPSLPGRVPTIEITGVVTDQPTGTVSSPACASDGFSSTGLVQVYDLPGSPPRYPGRPPTLINTTTATADDGTTAFTITVRLIAPYDSLRLLVDVCRNPADPQIEAPSYCGTETVFVVSGPPTVHPGG